MKISSTVRDLPSSERPRERLLQFGAEVMSVPELLALVLGSGNKGKSVMTLSQELLNQFGNHKKLADASVTELCKVTGIKFAKAAKIKAAFELGKRLNEFIEEGLGVFQHERTHAVKAKTVKKATKKKAVKTSRARNNR